MSESPLVAELFGLRSHGLILGVTTFGYCIGAAAGPFLAGYIFDVTGSYSVAFLACAAVSVLGLILSAVLNRLRELLNPKHQILNKFKYLNPKYQIP